MKTSIKRAVLFVVLTLCTPTLSLAQDASSAPVTQKVHNHKRGYFKGFRRGICVGQTLAQQGVSLPKAQPGQRPNLDPATKAAFKAAVQSCRAQAKGTASQS